MATSTVARGGKGTAGSPSSLFLLLASVAVAYAQTVTPSNTSILDISMTQMTLTGGPLPKAQTTYQIVPLTEGVGKGQSPAALQQLSISGILKEADPQTSMNLTSGDIAYITCDPNGSNIDASTVLQSAGALKPKAIVLYSLSYNECNLTGTSSYQSIFSMTSVTDSNGLLSTIELYPPETDILQAMIGTNTTTASSSSTSSSANQGGPAPTTAVAMSILYSITGIITLLFLIIIATGAVRAHRHPERYGPRNGFAGRPRQSRAKGLARAMLETLPIVKFGDPEPVKPGTRDIELEDGTSSNAAPTHTTPQQEEGTTARPKTPEGAAAAVAEGTEVRQEGSEKDKAKEKEPAAPTPPQEGDLGCSICTEDFTTGEDVRVLPCQHKYHPACIDPWLLNVSGTCPLCRHDLRPESSSGPTSPTDPNTRESSDLPPPLNVDSEHNESSEDASTPQQRRRRSRFLELSRLRTAPPEERIAALRELREQSRTEEPADDAEEQQSRRTRLTGRLREKFRIRTGTQNQS